MSPEELSKTARICPKCLSPVSMTDDVCIDCGWRLTAPADTEDSAAYPRLAQANLARVRGDYALAKDQCLAVLRTYPNNATAHVLMGDICMDAEEFEQAVEWYEIAADMDPEAPGLAAKLSEAKSLVAGIQSATTAELIGLPKERPRVSLYATLAIFIIVVAGIVGLLIRIAMSRQAEQFKPVETPIVVDRNSGAQQGDAMRTEGAGSSNGSAASGTDATGATTSEGLALLDRARKCDEGQRITQAEWSGEGKKLFLTVLVGQGEDRRAIAATIAVSALHTFNDAEVVVIRETTEGATVYSAEATRAKYNEMIQESGTIPEQRRIEILSQEAPPPTPSESPTSPPPTTGDSNSRQ